jgi:hypothetical protein
MSRICFRCHVKQGYQPFEFHASHTPQVWHWVTFDGVKRKQATRHPKNPRCTPDYTGDIFSNIRRLQEGRWFSLGDITNYIMIHWTLMIGFLKDNREIEAPAAMNRLDIARLDEVMVIFT